MSIWKILSYNSFIFPTYYFGYGAYMCLYAPKRKEACFETRCINE